MQPEWFKIPTASFVIRWWRRMRIYSFIVVTSLRYGAIFLTVLVSNGSFLIMLSLISGNGAIKR